jgi:magnesium-transporting ATPase (P-type)
MEVFWALVIIWLFLGVIALVITFFHYGLNPKYGKGYLLEDGWKQFWTNSFFIVLLGFISLFGILSEINDEFWENNLK